MSQLVFSIHWNPDEVGSKASEGMDLLTRGGQASEEQNLPSSKPLYRLPAEGVAQIGGMSFPTSRSGLKEDLPASN